MATISEDALPGLARQLERSGMTAYRLAKNLGWKPGTINRYLKGERFPTKWRLDMISQQLDCRVEDLFSNGPEK